MKMKKQIPIEENNITFIEEFNSTELVQSFNDKTNEVINAFFSILTYEKTAIVNLLTVDEAMLLTDIMYVNKYICQISPKIFLKEHIKNTSVLGKINSTYAIDVKSLLDKINNLAENQSYLLITLACKVNAEKNKEGNEDYIALVKKEFLINDFKHKDNVV